MNSPGASSLLQEFTTQQNENAFLRAFSFSTIQLPVDPASDVQLADRVIIVDDIGFIFQLMEREHKVASKPGDLEKWITSYVVRRGVKQIQNTRDLLKSYLGLSLVNNFGHRVLLSRKDPDLLVSVIVYRVPPKTRAFRAAQFKRNRNGGFVHILSDTDYFEIVHHFETPAELTDYFAFRRDILIDWDPAARTVSEAALIGQYLLDDSESAPDEKFESAARSHGGQPACEFSFVLDSLASTIASQESDYADTDCYDVLTELARLARYELRALKQQCRLALEAVRGNRLELPYRIASTQTGTGFMVLPVTKEFHSRASKALRSLSLASKYELDLERQVGIGMWRNSEFVDIEWIFLNGRNRADPDLDERLANNYPFRRSSEQRLPPIFV
ncbi:MAG: hypothetical protein QOD47_696 [Gemmatimonadaceae bacterium]|nr:hypothetical protein [Gemmatimonadaceae bacterium]